LSSHRYGPEVPGSFECHNPIPEDAIADMEENEAFDPSGLCLFRPIAVMAHPDRRSNAVKKPRALLRKRLSFAVHGKNPSDLSSGKQ